MRWKYGIFLGRSMASGKTFLTLSDGFVARARAMARVVPSNRWDHGRTLRVCATPLSENSRALDTIEEEENPHTDSISEQPRRSRSS